MNKAILYGHVGKDAEIVPHANGNICKFNIATSETWTDRSGEKQKRVDWHRITTFGKLAEICEKYIRKGMPVLVEGKIQTREYQREGGSKGYSTEIIAEHVQFAGPKQTQNQEPNFNRSGEYPF